MFQQNELIPEIKRLRRFSKRLMKNRHDSEDLLQSTLLRALEKNTYFESGTNLFRWTSKIMFNIFVTEYRRKKRHDTQYDPAIFIDRIAVDPPQENHVDLVIINECMKKMTFEQREILILICVQGMHYEEAAKVLHIPIGTVRSRLSRARAQLQKTQEKQALHFKKDILQSQKRYA